LLRVGLRGYDLPRSQRPPANLVFLVDVSGSMNSPDKLPLVRAALSGLANNIRAHDRVSIVVYAGAAGLVLPATNDKSEIRAALDRLEAGGSTAGGAGLQLAYRVARDNMMEGGVNRVILATDGDFNVGVTGTPALIEMIERERDSGVTLTTLGFGTGNYNEALMEQVADHGNGNYAYIDSALEAEKVLTDEMASTLFTIAKDVKIQVEFNPALVSQYRLIGYENRALREEDFDNDRIDAGEIGAGHQVTAIYEIVPAGAQGWIGPRRYEASALVSAAADANELAYVKLRYKLPDGETSRLIERAVPARLLGEAALPRGDMAFATAVAAYGQKLRGDTLLGDYGFRQIVSLAGGQDDFWRQEFLRLATLAEGLDES
jgi:Ca-activated chloride channel family protein